MKIVFDDKFNNSEYSTDPAAAKGRLDGIMEIVNKNKKLYEVITPVPAKDEDVLRAHTIRHLERISMDGLLFELSALAAGASITAAVEAYKGNPSFAVIRPPGHHASSDSCWGFCFFNNISISLLRLFYEGKIKSAFVLDFDLHTGDGNINILEKRGDGFRVSILNPHSIGRSDYIREVKAYMESLKDADIFAASAGFDQGIDDWGNLLYPEDYTELGRLMKVYSEKICSGRRYALLEGGYNHEAVAMNFDAFCQGFN
ncbi:MAG: histone deacetylase [Spirochaetes bacterium]|jgi:acetoin utilization deacetylase AcuC-like enzyme|nr:histone deacetylase [Spirochaetota bacterium]